MIKRSVSGARAHTLLWGSHRHAVEDLTPPFLTSRPSGPGFVRQFVHDPKERVFRGRDFPAPVDTSLGVTDAEKRHRETQPSVQSHMTNSKQDQAAHL